MDYLLQNDTKYSMKTKVVTKTWGNELWLVNNKLYCGKILTCLKDKWSSKS